MAVTFSQLAGSGGAQTTTSSGTGAFPTQMSVSQFQSDYGISSSDLALYQTNGQLNYNALALMEYHDMTQTERQTLQQTLVQTGRLKASDATGLLDNAAATTAFKAALGDAAANGYNGTSASPLAGYVAYLNNVGNGGLGSIENQISSNLSSATSTLASQRPVAATLENPTTLRATLNNAFAQTLGYALSEQQLDSFVSAMQGQDVAYAEAGVNQNRANAQSEVGQAQAEDSALNKMGKDGVDTFLSAYLNAVHGTGVAGAGTQQGPAMGASPVTAPASAAEGPFLPGQNPNAYTPVTSEVNALSGPQPVYTQGGPTGAERVTAPTISGNSLTPAPGSELAKMLGQQHGGLYALSPMLWQQAVNALGKNNAIWGGEPPPATAAQASTTDQTAAVKALALNLYQQTGNWSNVAVTLAGGNPTKAGSEHVLNTSTNLQTFATGIANDVNNQIQALQTQVNQAPAITEKVTAPDAAAEANQAAKQADPVGYYAANAASFGGILNQMLAGAPQMYQNTTADTFTGPVGAQVAAAA